MNLKYDMIHNHTGISLINLPMPRPKKLEKLDYCWGRCSTGLSFDIEVQLTGYSQSVLI